MEKQCDFSIIADQTDLRDVIGCVLEDGPTEEPIHVIDLDDVVNKHDIWLRQLPRVKPFYAIKCNDTPGIVQVLEMLGTGFDCASKGEMEKVLGIGVSPDRIIFAQPAKPIDSLIYAKKHGVNLMTFDGVHELNKMKKYFPEALLVLRFRYDSGKSFASMGDKFGCDAESEAPELLRQAKQLGLNVIGLSFHIGSGGNDWKSFEGAFGVARKSFDFAKSIGYDFTLLDIGGGFPGARGKPLDPYAKHINEAIDTYFASYSNVQFIAEPGRYYSTSAVTIVTNVQSKRLVKYKDGHELMFYYVNDGIFGSFYSAGHENQPVYPVPLKKEGRIKQSAIWGPSCDPLDLICKSIPLPELDFGDFILFENAGAYSIVIANQFNGFPLPRVEAYIRESTWHTLQNLAKNSC
ncbi:antizyme inhibitor 2-like isoform X2 [Topomyia yanbarensis]|uniref:antizyme inhibitor 2-like isoform X2 n=1 Tax=Topomyia yanbarensis TaxID=2498891 RepID=UPI00273B7BD6|nr:antizyme inhibitor 2-like isoform X2 [Topomyia yanbarensis]